MRIPGRDRELLQTQQSERCSHTRTAPSSLSSHRWRRPGEILELERAKIVTIPVRLLTDSTGRNGHHLPDHVVLMILARRGALKSLIIVIFIFTQ